MLHALMFSWMAGIGARMWRSRRHRVESAETEGRKLHRPRLYDLLLGLMMGGRTRRLRERTLAVADPRPGEAVLDLGCGTGDLARLLHTRVGEAGYIAAIDAAGEMVARARAKAGPTPIDFRVVAAEALPFETGRFDLVISSLFFHHLPQPEKLATIQEAARVLRPGGRFVAVDVPGSPTLSARLRTLHGMPPEGESPLCALEEPLARAGFDSIACGPHANGPLHVLTARHSPAD